MKPSGGVLGTYTSFGGQAGTQAPASHFSMLRHFAPQSPPAAGAAEAAPEATGAPDATGTPDTAAAPESVEGAVPEPAEAGAVPVVADGAEFDAPEEEHATSPAAATIQQSRLTRRTLLERSPRVRSPVIHARKPMIWP